MTNRIEVYADITCPFAHVGLKQVARHVREHGQPIAVVVRAWPLEWVNGSPLEVEGVVAKARALEEQLGVDDFSGLRADRWPASTIPALNLVADAYARDAATGFAVSLDVRAALFERGQDITDPEVLAAIATAHGLTTPAVTPEACDAVQADYAAGQACGVKGSPHFWVDLDDFFCPALELGHDEAGHLTARLDTAALAEFFARMDR